jgi:hypothetical protein
VIVGSGLTGLSPPLQTILGQLAGRQARPPVRWAITSEYLAYHRAVVLQGKPPAPEGADVEGSGVVVA